MTCPCLDGIEDLRARPVLVLDNAEQNPGEGGGFQLELFLQGVARSTLEGLKRIDHSGRESLIHLDEAPSLENHRQREDGKDQQNEHEETALDKEFDESRGGEEKVWMHGV